MNPINSQVPLENIRETLFELVLLEKENQNVSNLTTFFNKPRFINKLTPWGLCRDFFIWVWDKFFNTHISEKWIVESKQRVFTALNYHTKHIESIIYEQSEVEGDIEEFSATFHPFEKLCRLEGERSLKIKSLFLDLFQVGPPVLEDLLCRWNRIHESLWLYRFSKSTSIEIPFRALKELVCVQWKEGQPLYRDIEDWFTALSIQSDHDRITFKNSREFLEARALKILKFLPKLWRYLTHETSYFNPYMDFGRFVVILKAHGMRDNLPKSFRPMPNVVIPENYVVKPFERISQYYAFQIFALSDSCVPWKNICHISDKGWALVEKVIEDDCGRSERLMLVMGDLPLFGKYQDKFYSDLVDVTYENKLVTCYPLKPSRPCLKDAFFFINDLGQKKISELTFLINTENFNKTLIGSLMQAVRIAAGLKKYRNNEELFSWRDPSQLLEECEKVLIVHRSLISSLLKEVVNLKRIPREQVLSLHDKYWPKLSVYILPTDFLEAGSSEKYLALLLESKEMEEGYSLHTV